MTQPDKPSSLHPHPGARPGEGASSTRRGLRGFAAMDPARQREIASLGGRAAHQSGHAHEFTSEEARAAGRKRHQRASPARAEDNPPPPAPAPSSP